MAKDTAPNKPDESKADAPQADAPKDMRTTAERYDIKLTPRQCAWCLTDNSSHNAPKCEHCRRKL